MKIKFLIRISPQTVNAKLSLSIITLIGLKEKNYHFSVTFIIPEIQLNLFHPKDQMYKVPDN